MFKTLGRIVAVAGLLLGGVQAHAAVNNSGSIVYLDNNGNPVGQQITYCSSTTQHAGIVYSQYKVVFTWKCPTGFYEGDIPGMSVENFILPAGISITNACTQIGAGICTSTVPLIINGSWTYLPGSGQ